MHIRHRGRGPLLPSRPCPSTAALSVATSRSQAPLIGHDGVVDAVGGNRRAWDVASQKYVKESDAFHAAAEAGTLVEVEVALIAPLLDRSVVLHLQSGNGTDDAALCRLGAAAVVGIDFSIVAARAARDRARALGEPITYAVADAVVLPITSGAIDVVYTGKGALMWLPDLATWASEVSRVLRSGGHLFLYEAHPAAALWTLDDDPPRVRPDRNYFGGTRRNDSFPASAIERFGTGAEEAIEWQWTLADVVTALLGAGLRVEHLGEHPEPFWRPADAGAVPAWAGTLPNAFSLLAAKPR
jgi:SAM-dependent methyltransferase